MLGYVVDVIIFDFSTKRKGMFFYNKRVWALMILVRIFQH
jgi:hypothetical protein